MDRIDKYFNKVITAMVKIDKESILSVAKAIDSCKGNVYVFGNGGSASTASHFAQDMNKIIGHRFICLNDNVPSILAYGNDDGFESVFISQLRGFLNEGDLVIGISCSGNSVNVLEALALAARWGNNVISFTGFDGGDIKKLTGGIHVPSSDMQVCEDMHLMVTHLLIKIIETY